MVPVSQPWCVWLSAGCHGDCCDDNDEIVHDVFKMLQEITQEERGVKYATVLFDMLQCILW